MRFGSNSRSVLKYNNNFIGFDLGFGFCAEHEWGIKKLLYAFKVNTNKIGIDRITIKECPEFLIFSPVMYKNTQCYLLLCSSLSARLNYEINEKLLENLNLYPYKLNDGHDLLTAWDERSFAILVTEKYKDEITELYNAFKNLDIVIGLSSNDCIDIKGLAICIKSKLPKKVIKTYTENDLDEIRLQKAVKKTKIEKILAKAGKKYFALSPKWKNAEKTEIIFWLNPYDQDKYNFGWFTVQDLKDWAKDTGKVIMTK